jgi:DNA repair protein RecN (Recombination protein N)
MIVALRVRDLATIADVSLPLGPGLNVLTGETGAGKSMLVDALALLLGARADTSAVRPGASRLAVEGAFEGIPPAVRRQLEAQGLEAESDQLVIRREVSVEGRSRAWVNGSPTTVGGLAILGALLMDLHGQHETRTLLEPERQRDVLDAFGDAQPEGHAVAEAADAVEDLARQEAELAARLEDVRRRADYLSHVVAEIEAARLHPGEEEALEIEARRLSQVGTLSDLVRRITDAVGGDEHSALTALGGADRLLGALERADPSVAAWREVLDGAFANLQELSRFAEEYAGTLQEDPERLGRLERRRDLLFRLKGKYGDTLDAIIATGKRSSEELAVLDTADLDLRTLARRRETAQAALTTAAGALSTKRQAAAGRLERAVNRLLPRLGLSGGRIQVVLRAAEAPGRTGQETVEFQVELNEGMGIRPIAGTASGGELSRLVLAITTVLGRHDRVGTLVFDEVDQGISAEVGNRVGEALAEVATRHQVLVITHLAPIAAQADHHVTIAKQARRGLATSDVQVLHGEDRVNELARMLGDAEAATARRHALALLAGRA